MLKACRLEMSLYNFRNALFNNEQREKGNKKIRKPTFLPCFPSLALGVFFDHKNILRSSSASLHRVLLASFPCTPIATTDSSPSRLIYFYPQEPPYLPLDVEIVRKSPNSGGAPAVSLVVITCRQQITRREGTQLVRWSRAGSAWFLSDFDEINGGGKGLGGGLIDENSGSLLVLSDATPSPVVVENEGEDLWGLDRSKEEEEGSCGGLRTTTEPEPPLIQGVGSRTRVRFQLPGEKQLMEESDQLLQGLGPRFQPVGSWISLKIFKKKRILQGYMVGIKLDWRGNVNGGLIEWGNTLIQSKLVPVVYGISVVTTSMELYLPQWATMRLVDLSLMVNKLSGPFPRVLSRITTLVPLTAVTSIIDGLKKLYIQKLKPLEVTYWGPDCDPPNPIFFYPIISQERSNGSMPCWCRSTWGTYSRLKLTAPFARCKMAGFTGVSGIMIRETVETSIAMFICFQRSSIAIISHLSL
ncbi:unnamed protein product [Lactuca saligna]|uniref:EH domain-containing protein n=1 Tax=Lactuca saligna TaxID=75948 RepID=A0AA35YY43_LACSI|nr:unnamed protein product [Lactuca saligna]